MQKRLETTCGIKCGASWCCVWTDGQSHSSDQTNRTVLQRGRIPGVEAESGKLSEQQERSWAEQRVHERWCEQTEEFKLQATRSHRCGLQTSKEAIDQVIHMREAGTHGEGVSIDDSEAEVWTLQEGGSHR